MRLVTMSGAGALIDHRGGPRYGPPDPSSERGYAPLGLPPPSRGRAPAQPWRASGLTQDVSSMPPLGGSHGLRKGGGVRVDLLARALLGHGHQQAVGEGAVVRLER